MNAIATIEPDYAAAVIAAPGLTAAQYAVRLATDREAVLAGLQRDSRLGLVHAAELTRCPLTSHLANVWRPGRDPQIGSATPPIVLADYAAALMRVVPPVDPVFAMDVVE